MTPLKSFLLLSLLAMAGPPALAQPTLHAFGLGGPAPAMKAAAQAFEKKAGVKIKVVAGPTGAWLERAKTEGDLIFNGSEVMMSDFVAAMGGQIAEETIAPL